MKTMQVQVFEDSLRTYGCDKLRDFVNNNNIKQEAIIGITQSPGIYTLFYFV